MANHVTGGMSRDEACASGASFLASLGAFGEDILMYGCAYLEQGKVTYRISSEGSRIHQFKQNSAHQQVYPTAINSYIERITVPADLREQTMHQTKLTLARKLQEQYPRCFFELLEPLAQTPANNSSFALLAQMADAADGYFNDGQLQLLEGTIEIAYNAKVLQESSYRELMQWLKKTRQQTADDTVVQATPCRTLYGFCYQENNSTIQCSMNAQILKAYERRAELERAGKLTGPFIQRTYWLKELSLISTAREQFGTLLKQLQNQSYFSLLSAIKKLPTAINQDAFQQALSQIERTGKPQAIADFKQYGRLWNVLP